MSRREGSVTASQVILLVSFLARMGLALGITSVLGRALSPAGFGFYALVGTIFFLAHVLLDLGTGSVATREIARAPERERPILEGLLAWRRIVGAVLAVGVVVAAFWERDSDRRLILLGTAGLLPLMAPGALSVVFQVRQAQGGPAIVGIVTQSLVLLGAMVMALLGLPGAMFSWLIIGREALNLAACRHLALDLLSFRPRAGWRGRDLRPFLGRAFVQGMAVLVQTAYFHLDVLMVRSLRGESELGAYAAAFRPINILLLLPSLLLAPLLPILSRDKEEEPARFRSRVSQATTVMSGAGLCGVILGVLLARELLEVLYGSTYAGGDFSAEGAFLWMCLALGVVCVGSTVVLALLAAGRERALLHVSLFGLAVNVAGNLALLPVFGFEAAAFTTFLTEATVVISACVVYRRTAGAWPFRFDGLTTFLPALLLGAVMVLLPAEGALRVLVGGVLGIFGVVLVLTGRAARELRKGLGR